MRRLGARFYGFTAKDIAAHLRTHPPRVVAFAKALGIPRLRVPGPSKFFKMYVYSQQGAERILMEWHRRRGVMVLKAVEREMDPRKQRKHEQRVKRLRALRERSRQ